MNELKKQLSELGKRFSGLKPSGKGPGLRFPAFANDVYRDLRDRHLLPLVALLIVAIAAVPFLLSDSGESGLPIPAAPPTASPSSDRSVKQVVVAETNEGLRKYSLRFKHRKAVDPFKEKYGQPPAEGGESGSSLEEAPSESAPPEEVPTEETPGGGSTGGGSTSPGTETHTEGELRYLSWELDVRVVPVSTNGVPSKAKPTVRRNLPELTPLPGRKAPALTFMQPSGDGKKALMLVNANVKGLFGEAVCASGSETCQLLALEEGLPETVVYGGNERIFKIEVLKIHLEVTKTLKKAKAPLGSKQTG